MATTFAEATSIQAIDSHRYSAYLHNDWCVGSVPHGGYVTSCLLSTAKLHFETTLRSSNQPHTIALQLSFLRRSSNGPATFTVSEFKLGRRTSTIHISLTQGADKQLPNVVCYLTQSNLDTENGLSLNTEYSLFPPPIHFTSTEALRTNSEPNWALSEKKFNKFRKAGRHVRTYLPINGQVGQALIDQWLCFENGERFMQETLGYVADSFPQIMESAKTQGDLEREMKLLQAQSHHTPNKSDAARSKDMRSDPERSQWASFWYPTVTLNLDIKKSLPPEGVEWLFSRVRAKRIQNGRMDIEVTIMDDGGDIVALSNHVALIVGAERNMVRDSVINIREGGSKL